MAPLAARLLEAVVRQDGPAAHGKQRGHRLARSVAGDAGRPRGGQPAAQDPDDAAAQRLFSPNVAMDAPFEERRRRIALIRERIGEFGDDPGRLPEFDTPAHCRWWSTAGARPSRRRSSSAVVELAAEGVVARPAGPPAAGSALRVTLDAVVDWLNGGERDWPPSIAVADGVDAGMLTRRLLMAAVWAGPCRVGAFKAGDGTASAAAELIGEHATITLALVIDPGNSHPPPSRRRPIALMPRPPMIMKDLVPLANDLLDQRKPLQKAVYRRPSRGRRRTRGRYRGPFGTRRGRSGTGPAGGHEPQPDVTWITWKSLRPREIDSDTRPFRIDSPGAQQALQVTQASTFPVPRQASSDPERDTWTRRPSTVAAG